MATFFFEIIIVNAVKVSDLGYKIRDYSKGRLSARKWMNFLKISEGEGGVVSDPKNFVAIFFA